MHRRRHFLGSTLAALVFGPAGCCRRSSEVAPFQTLAQLAYHLAARRLTARSVVAHYLDRIAVFDKTGPGINAILELAPDAAVSAQRLDTAGRASPLHGLPILLKDNIDTADGMETTAGSLALLGAPKPRQDATIVTALRHAGMVILGKANLSEWANIRSPNSTSGWSARGGLTVNPHRTTHSASGSSSGSAAAVAAGFVPAAIGTETNGSIVSPASACGIVGLKPTVGLVSRAGIIPITHWQDTAGPMTLTCWDAALLLNVLAGVDERDPMTAAAAGHIAADYTTGVSRDALRGARLGVLRSQCGRHAGVRGLFEETLEKLRAAGAVLVEVPELPNENRYGKAAWFAMLTELRADLNAYLVTRGGPIGSLADLIAFNRRNANREMPHFGQEFFEDSEQRNTPTILALAATARTAARQLIGPEGIDAALEEDRLDALICPTNDPPDRIDLANGDPSVRCASGPAAVAGYPHLTVPMGFVDGLPVGLSFLGAAWSEGRLLGLGHAFEILAQARREPVLVGNISA